MFQFLKARSSQYCCPSSNDPNDPLLSNSINYLNIHFVYVYFFWILLHVTDNYWKIILRCVCPQVLIIILCHLGIFISKIRLCAWIHLSLSFRHYNCLWWQCQRVCPWWAQKWSCGSHSEVDYKSQHDTRLDSNELLSAVAQCLWQWKSSCGKSS